MKSKILLFVFLYFVFSIIPTTAAVKVFDNPYYQYTTPSPLKFILIEDCFNVGASGCEYIYRNDISYNGYTYSYGYTNMGQVFPLTTAIQDITAFSVLLDVKNNTYPASVSLYTMTTSNPNDGKTLIKTCTYGESPGNHTSVTLSNCNLNTDLIVTDNNGNLLHNYLFLVIQNSDHNFGDIGYSTLANIREDDLWLSNDMYSVGSYTAGTFIKMKTQVNFGDTIYPAFNNSFGYSFPANNVDTRKYTKSFYYTIYGDYRFPQTPIPLPIPTNNAPLPCPDCITGNPLPSESDGSVFIYIPDFENSSIYCPTCQGNETFNQTNTIPINGTGSGFGKIFTGLGYCKTTGCIIDNIIDALYDFSITTFYLSIFIILIKVYVIWNRRE